MSLNICSLNSGSNGNCYYVGNEKEAVFIDAGLTCKETEKRMFNLGLEFNKVKAIIISHEHTDHIKGMKSLSDKYSLPIFISKPTMKSFGNSINENLVRHFTSYEDILIGELSITPFPKHHDAADPHSFVVSHNDVKVGVFTDIGIVCDRLKKFFNQCHAAFLESNYDEQMLENGRYPSFLKNRIRGGNGHLSNDQALMLFKNHSSGQLSHLLLSHLSKENNCPIKTKELFTNNCKHTEIVIASRYEASEVYRISKPAFRSTSTDSYILKKKVKPVQLAFFN